MRASPGKSGGRRSEPAAELNDLDRQIFLPSFRECFPPGFFAFSISPSKPPSRRRSFPLFPTFSVSWTMRRPVR